jgi:hypothetical protein
MEAGWQSVLPSGHVTLLPQYDGTALIVADNMERVLADIDADHGDSAVELPGHRVLLVFGAPSQLLSLVGAGARLDHPVSGLRLQVIGG